MAGNTARSNLSAITLAELRFGIAVSHRRTLNLAKLEFFLASFEGVAFDDRAAVAWKFDRLARSLKQLIETVELLSARQIGLRSLTESIDTTTAGSKLVFHGFGALAEFERSIIRERTKAGARDRPSPDRRRAARAHRQGSCGGQGPACGSRDHRGRGGQAAERRALESSTGTCRAGAGRSWKGDCREHRRAAKARSREEYGPVLPDLGDS